MCVTEFSALICLKILVSNIRQNSAQQIKIVTAPLTISPSANFSSFIYLNKFSAVIAPKTKRTAPAKTSSTSIIDSPAS